MHAVSDIAASLVCHPDSRCESVHEIDVDLEQAKSGNLILRLSLAGDLSALSIPESSLSRRADKLWEHTCFEAFLMAGEGPGYLEFNFSPSGEWAVFAFRGYRERRDLAVEAAPGIVVYRSDDLLELSAEISGEYIPSGGPLRLGLSTVVEDAQGVKSYWALRHPAAKPDFHHVDSFVLEI